MVPPFPFPKTLFSSTASIFIPPQRRIKGSTRATGCFFKCLSKTLKFMTHCTEINQIPALGLQLEPGESATGGMGRKMSTISVLHPHRKILTTLGSWSIFQYLVTTKNRTPFTQRQQNKCSVRQSPPTFVHFYLSLTSSFCEDMSWLEAWYFVLQRLLPNSCHCYFHLAQSSFNSWWLWPL